MSWLSREESYFKKAFGFHETDYESTQKMLLSLLQFKPDAYGREEAMFVAHDRTLSAGSFYAPTLKALREEAAALAKQFVGENPPPAQMKVSNIVGDSNGLHSDPRFVNGVFQAASQFNLLEMPGPGVTPEKGISGYSYDHTQGPACATACAAGTAYRNYTCFRGPTIPRGQRSDDQINTLAEATEKVVNPNVPEGFRPWRVKNGYIESTPDALDNVNKLIFSNPALRTQFRDLIQIGVHYDVEVTRERLRCTPPFVTQTYNSAVSIGYSRCCDDDWKPLACTVLDATYEATLLVGIINKLRHLHKLSTRTSSTVDPTSASAFPVLLTKVGGGVFRNPLDWIKESMERAITSVAQLGVPLEILVTHYGGVDREFHTLFGQRLGLFGEQQQVAEAKRSRDEKEEASNEEETFEKIVVSKSLTPTQVLSLALKVNLEDLTGSESMMVNFPDYEPISVVRSKSHPAAAALDELQGKPLWDYLEQQWKSAESTELGEKGFVTLDIRVSPDDQRRFVVDFL